ncbi:MAG: hypothetical protein J2P52_13255, partial [Blastocatellia bacterium]|nr:hypothetical protein [Blastocatellia bacterium]
TSIRERNCRRQINKFGGERMWGIYSQVLNRNIFPYFMERYSDNMNQEVSSVSMRDAVAAPLPLQKSFNTHEISKITEITEPQDDLGYCRQPPPSAL